MRQTTLEQELRAGNNCVSTTVGTSMYPMLRNRRDTVIIEPVRHELRRYDLPLYKRPNGQYVLHRILRVKEDGYVICGDHCWQKEDPVPKEWILGVVTGFYRDNTYISVKNPLYQAYVHIWCDFFWMRSLILRTRARVGGVKRRIRRKLGLSK